MYKFAVWTAAGVIGAAAPVTTAAGSPEFARTSQEWERLQDPVLEYEEIPDLIHEYNVTVQNNQYEYNKFIKDYGRTREDIAQSYRDLADDLESSMSGDGSGMGMVGDLQLEIQAKQLREQADDSLEDSQIYYWTYAKEEDTLVLSAQSRFIDYYRKQLELESAQEEKRNLEREYSVVEARRQAHMATGSEVSDICEKLMEQEKTIEELEQGIEDIRQKLIVILGWQGNDQPKIQDVPKVELSELACIDLEADQKKAQEHNYILKINEKKLENAEDEDSKTRLANTIEGNKRQIAVSVTGVWQKLQTAKREYDQAQANVLTEERNTELMRQKWEVGIITKKEYESQQSILNITRISAQTAELDLLEAWETYQWNVKGLAAAE